MSETERARARGDAGFVINPERRDEARYGGLMQSFATGKERAREEARNALLNSARAITGAGAAAPVQAAQARQMANFDNRTAALSSLPFGVEALGDLFQGFQGDEPERQTNQVLD
jgi:hypothetical protein